MIYAIIKTILSASFFGGLAGLLMRWRLRCQMRLHEVWEAFRKGKPIESKSLDVWMRFSKDDPWYGGDCIYNKDGCNDDIFGIESLDWLDATDWEVARERLADYLIDGRVETHPVGAQPSNVGPIPGSERWADEA
jgi:hypothetical protein